MESAKEAWNAGSVDGVLDKYVDDIVYTTNTGGPQGAFLTLRGKDAVRSRFQAAMGVVDAQSRIQSVRVDNGFVRTRLIVDMRHRETGHTLTCSLRQILRFEGFRIDEQQDFHDAAKIAAFWRLVGAPIERLSNPLSVLGDTEKA